MRESPWSKWSDGPAKEVLKPTLSPRGVLGSGPIPFGELEQPLRREVLLVTNRQTVVEGPDVEPPRPTPWLRLTFDSRLPPARTLAHDSDHLIPPEGY